MKFQFSAADELLVDGGKRRFIVSLVIRDGGNVFVNAAVVTVVVIVVIVVFVVDDVDVSYVVCDCD